MQKESYTLQSMENIISPAFIFYLDIVRENTRRAIELAGGAEWLWPHVKTHKTEKLIAMQMELGIRRFKCATIAEAEMLCNLGAEHILLAYPLVSPNIRRFLMLKRAFPNSTLYAIGDDYGQLALLSESAQKLQLTVPVLLDVNVGMNRTGVALDKAEALYRRCADLPGLTMLGLHCYDGHNSMKNREERNQNVVRMDECVLQLQAGLRAQGLCCDLLVVGGTPSFPCHACKKGLYHSPGTVFVFDLEYLDIMPDEGLVPAAAVFTRVVSHPGESLFTLDLGSKGISSDNPQEARGLIIGMEQAKPLKQSEEHWVFSMSEGEALPPIGTGLYVIPRHICPTSPLYPSILIAEGGEIVDEWEVTVRNRTLRY